MKPLLLSPEMAVQVFRYRKTQTRRPMKRQPKCTFGSENNSLTKYCPHGKPGDFLWVRETHFLYGHWVKNGLNAKGKVKWKFIPNANMVSKKEVRFTDNPPFPVQTTKNSVGWFKRPSIFMPRWACRSILQITEVRAPLLNEITEEDARAEGVPFDGKYFLGGIHPIKGTPQCWAKAKEAFEKRWGVLYPGSWKKNPRVWALTFKRIKPGKAIYSQDAECNLIGGK